MNKNDQLTQSLIDYINDVKPFHTKFREVSSQIFFEDQFNVNLQESYTIETHLGNVWGRDELGGFSLQKLSEGDVDDKTYVLPATVFSNFSLNDSVNWSQTPPGSDPATLNADGTSAPFIDLNNDGIPDSENPWEVSAGAFVTGNNYTIQSLGTTDFTSVGATTVNAGSFVYGTPYVIKSIGTTDFTLFGAPSNTVGTMFIASGVGTIYITQGLAQGGASSSLTLAATASSVTDIYANNQLSITAGTGAGQQRNILTSRKNLITRSQSYLSADAWQGTAIVTTGVVDPSGGLNACTVSGTTTQVTAEWKNSIYQESLIDPLKNTLTLSRGTGASTYTRASTATFLDFESNLKTALSGEARFVGARRVQNRCLGSSQDFSNVNWVLTNAIKSTGVADPTGGTTAATITATIDGGYCINLNPTASALSTKTNSLWIRRRTGTGTVSIINAGNTAWVPIPVTSQWQQFSGGTITAGTAYAVGVQMAISGDAVDIAFAQVEDVTGNLNQCASEYVSVGVLPAPYHGAGVDGVQYFSYRFSSQYGLAAQAAASTTLTLNSGSSSSADLYASSTVTITSGTGVGQTRNVIASRKNLLTYSQKLSLWSPSNCTVVDNSTAAPDGTVTASLVTVTNVANPMVTQLFTSTVGTTYTFSFYVKANTKSTCDIEMYNNGVGLPTFVGSGIISGPGTINTGFSSATISGLSTTQWTRCYVTATAVGTNLACSFKPQDTVITVGDSYYIYGAQLELGVTASAYIHTEVNPAVGVTVDVPWVTIPDSTSFYNLISNNMAIPDATLKGYLSEPVATNYAIWSRDLTNAAWTKTNVTAVLDQLGIDGGTNSASSLVSTLANGTVTQSIVLASQTSTLSIWIKRLVGTGPILITCDNVTYTDVTAQINSNTYSLVQLSQTLINPVIGIKIATLGDKIAVDAVQFESGSVATTPVFTTTTSLTRSPDVDSYPSTGNVTAAQGSVYLEFTPNHAPIAATLLYLWSTYVDTNNYTSILHDGTNLIFRKRIAGVNYDSTTPLAYVTGTRYKVGAKWSSTGSVVYLNGTTGTASANTTAAQIGSTIQIGTDGNGAEQPAFSVSNVHVWQTALPDDALADVTGGTIAAPALTNQIWLRRRSGTGAVSIPTGFNNWTPVTLTNNWQKFSNNSAYATGVKLATLTDSVDMAFGMIESNTGLLASVPSQYIHTDANAAVGVAVDAPWTNTLLSTADWTDPYWTHTTTVTATNVADTSTTTYQTLYKSLTIAALGQPYVLSLIVTKDAVSRTTRYPMLRLMIPDATPTQKYAEVRFDTSTGSFFTFSTPGVVVNGSGVIDLGTEWLVWVSMTQNISAQGVVQAFIYPAIGAYTTNWNYDVTTTGSIDCRQLRLETGTYPTRVPDSTSTYAISNTGTGAVYNTTFTATGLGTGTGKAILNTSSHQVGNRQVSVDAKIFSVVYGNTTLSVTFDASGESLYGFDPNLIKININGTDYNRDNTASFVKTYTPITGYSLAATIVMPLPPGLTAPANNIQVTYLGTGRFAVPFHQGSRVRVDNVLQKLGYDYVISKSRGFIQFLPNKHPGLTQHVDINLMTSDKLFICKQDPFAYTGGTIDTFTITAASVPGMVSGGSFVTGTGYTIMSVGTTDFTRIGAQANSVGLSFIATGQGSGTGFAAPDSMLALQLRSKDIIAGHTYTIISQGSADYTLFGAANNNPGTTFTAIASGTATAGSFIPYATYVILTVGNSDFTSFSNATSNTPGQPFVTTNVGSGTGTAALYDTGLIVPSTICNVQFNNTDVNTHKAQLTNVSTSASAGTVWTLNAIGPWTLNVQRSSPLDSTTYKAFFKTPFNNGELSFTLDRTWLNHYVNSDKTYDSYYIEQDVNSYYSYDEAMLQTSDSYGAEEFFPNLDSVTEHGLAIDPVPGRHSPVRFTPFGVVSKTVDGQYKFTFDSIPPRFSYIEFKVEKVGQYNPWVRTSIREDAKLYVTYNTVSEGNIVAGNTYIIGTIGNTDFTALGAPSNTIGVMFVALSNGNPVGTGTAARVQQVNLSADLVE